MLVKHCSRVWSVLSGISLRGQIKLEPHPDWSLLGVSFKFSDKHPRPFHIRVSHQATLYLIRQPLRQFLRFKKPSQNYKSKEFQQHYEENYSPSVRKKTS